MTSSRNGMDQALVRAHFRLRLSGRPRKLTPSRLNASAMKMSEKRKTLSRAIKTLLSPITNKPTGGILAENHGKTFKTVVKEAALMDGSRNDFKITTLLHHSNHSSAVTHGKICLLVGKLRTPQTTMCGHMFGQIKRSIGWK